MARMIKPSEGTRDVSSGGCNSLNLNHLLLASLGGLAAGAAAFAGESFLRRRRTHQGACMGNKDQKIAPLIGRKDSSRRSNLERFSYYVARQLGFEDPNECPQLCKLANAYLMKTKGYNENVYEYLVNEAEADSLYIHLLEEFERCILTYFAFNWTQSSNLISQILSDESDQKVPKLKDFVMAATRKQRFERVTKDLKVKRVFSTLVEEMKAINISSSGGSGEPHCTEVMSPVAHNKRSPVLLLMGGGMGAGKSTVLKDILQEPFWSEAGGDAVVIEADAFKETDVIYRALSSRGHHDDMLQTAELVHQSSTDAASSLLVTALNEGRDVIMDGTLAWVPFLEQTITMARNVHKHRYRMGVGYKVSEDGTTTEEYWRQETEQNGKQQNLKPYRIELVGVVCDAYLAVVRGIRRALMVKRAVRVRSQLQSHKSFANAFPKYCKLVDNARLYCTNAVAGPPQLIAWKSGNSNLLVDPEEIECLRRVSNLNPDAESINELYTDPNVLSKPGSVWNDIVLAPSRPKLQKQLTDAIRKIEKAQATK
ncbi:BnaC05g02390D [Brassica napus]|nr:PREDICTED: uncharacterized protein LOC106295740 isoform X1 [Brassica oleracea var. oleracea]XP_013698104.2 calmodulin calcium-dependent NAD kinase-like isoform X1 [Brassica napus]CAF1923669.1 unnamed protein product [Brassica napus]CDY18216.1 BnaC05g02390D [Brassica napus]